MHEQIYWRLKQLKFIIPNQIYKIVPIFLNSDWPRIFDVTRPRPITSSARHSVDQQRFSRKLFNQQLPYLIFTLQHPLALLEGKRVRSHGSQIKNKQIKIFFYFFSQNNKIFHKDEVLFLFQPCIYHLFFLYSHI